MDLLFAASPYTQEQLMNYKSLDCNQNFANGWLREVLYKEFGENRLLIAKVRFYNYLLKSVYTRKWWIKLLSSLLASIVDSLQYSNYVLFLG